ncbi:hypothetical protein CsSME_00008778 [Camellia sinensis var. sinensis]
MHSLDSGFEDECCCLLYVAALMHSPGSLCCCLLYDAVCLVANLVSGLEDVHMLECLGSPQCAFHLLCYSYARVQWTVVLSVPLFSCSSASNQE